MLEVVTTRRIVYRFMSQPESTPEKPLLTLEGIDQIINDPIISALLTKLQGFADAEAKLQGEGIQFHGTDDKGRVSWATLRLESYESRSVAALTFTFPQTMHYGFSSLESDKPIFYTPYHGSESELGFIRRAALSRRIKNLQPLEPEND